MKQVTQKEYEEFLDSLTFDIYWEGCCKSEPPTFNIYNKATRELVAQILDWCTDPKSRKFVPEHPKMEFCIKV